MRNTIYACLATLFILCGCGAKSDNLKSMVEYIPFQSCADGRWGLISTDGEVLFKDEFSEKISMAMNGRFFAKDKEGNWLIYTAEEQPQQVGNDAYKEIAPFSEDVTVAVKPGGHVAIIDRDGNEVKVLDAIDGKKVIRVSRFSQGVAYFQTEEDLYGAIDTNGDVIVAPEYCAMTKASDGKFFAIEKQYQEELGDDYETFDKTVAKIFDLGGNVINEIPFKGLYSVNPDFKDGCFIVKKKYGEEERCGIMDEQGEWVVNPSAKNKVIDEMQDKHFIFNDDGNYGLMDFDGNTVLRAKYDDMDFMADNLLSAQKEGEDNYSFIDFEGNPVGTADFTVAYGFYGAGDYCIVRFDSNDYGFVGTDGERLKLDKGIELYDIILNVGDDMVEDDFIDYAAYVASMNISSTSIDGIRLGISAERAASIVGQRRGETISAEDCTDESSLDYTREHRYSNLNFSIFFNKDFVSPITRTVYEEYYGYRFPREETTGYRFSDAKVDAIQIRLNVRFDKLEDKLIPLMAALKQKLTGMGRVIAERTDHTGIAVNLGSGNVAIAFIDREDKDILFIGIGRQDAINLDNARGAMESGDSSTANDETPIDTLADVYVDEEVLDSVVAD